MGGISLSKLKRYYIPIVIKKACYYWRERYIDKYKREGNPEIDPRNTLCHVGQKCKLV